MNIDGIKILAAFIRNHSEYFKVLKSSKKPEAVFRDLLQASGPMNESNSRKSAQTKN